MQWWKVCKHQSYCDKKIFPMTELWCSTKQSDSAWYEGPAETFIPYVDPWEATSAIIQFRKRAMCSSDSLLEREKNSHFLSEAFTPWSCLVQQYESHRWWVSLAPSIQTSPAGNQTINPHPTRGLSHPLSIATTSTSRLHQRRTERMPNTVVCLIPAPPDICYAI